MLSVVTVFRGRVPFLLSLLFCALLGTKTFADAPASPFVDPNPSPGNQFGAIVLPLATGNVVISAPNASGGAGAVYLFNGASGALISTLTGTSGGDHIGSAGIRALTNGNFVVLSPDWNAAAGAATWGSGTTGVSGAVSSANSLVGSNANDAVGLGLTALTNGNYVVRSANWNGVRGAATWGNGATGISGVVSSSNSLVGGTANDRVGTLFDLGIVALTNGNYVVRTPGFDGTAVNVGAVTWGNGTTGVTGVVSAANSLVGSTANDRIGYVADGPIQGVTALSNGNYVVRSPNWDGTLVDQGAVTWANGATGRVGVVSASNSLIGGSAGDRVGSGVVAALPAGDYVVGSPDFGGSKQGALTWGDGTSGTTGTVGGGNSLIGPSASARFGSSSVTPLPNGNYVVASPGIDIEPDGTFDTLAAYYICDGDCDTRGPAHNPGYVHLFSPSGALLTSSVGNGWEIRNLGSAGVRVLAGGDYLILTRAVQDFFNSDSLDLVRRRADGTDPALAYSDFFRTLIGPYLNVTPTPAVTVLANGSVVVASPNYGVTYLPAVDPDPCAAIDLWKGDQSDAAHQPFTLVADKTGDMDGVAVTPLANGNYVITFPSWDNGSLADVGAVVWGSGTSGVAGTVSPANALIGSFAGDRVGSGGVTPLDDGNYVVNSPNWHNGTAPDAGSTAWANGAAGITGVPGPLDGPIGAVASAGLLSVVPDTVNGGWFARFVDEAEGKVWRGPISPCLAGTSSSTGTGQPLACTPAPAGYYVPTQGATTPLACPVGKYQDLTGQTSCKNARPGHYVNVTGAAIDVVCAVGSSQASEGATSCDLASAGRFVDTEGAEASSPCPTGKYQALEGQSSCTPASVGHYVATSGAISEAACTAGTYQDLTGQTSCKPASAGYFVAIGGASSQTACASGYTSNAGATSCTRIPVSCSAGTFSANGTDDPNACTPATAGHYAAGSGATSETACAAGTYQDLTGQASCKLASAGYYVASGGASSQTACPSGRFQPLSGDFECNLATAGHYVPDAGSASETACAAGTFQPLMGQASCNPATTGHYVATSAAISESACPMGRYQDLTGQTSCKEATPGHFVDTTAAAQQTACPAGRFQPLSGAISCDAATAGHYVPAPGGIAETACAAGSYQPLTGQASCTLASADFYVPSSGATSQIACAPGTTSSAGATSCTPIVAPITLSVSGGSVTEGNAGTKAIPFTITRSGASASAVTVNWATASVSPGPGVVPATAGVDYRAALGVATIPAGPDGTSVTVNAFVNADTLDEDDEKFALVLTNPSAGTLVTDTAVGTILDDDAAPTLSITGTTVTEGSLVAGTTAANFRVALSAATSRTVTVHWSTGTGTATADVDFQSASGDLTFLPGGALSQNVTVLVNQDTLGEDNETFLVSLSAPTNAALGTGVATGQINNDDGSARIRITGGLPTDSTTIIVPEGSSTSASVYLTKATGVDITVDWTVTVTGATSSASCADFVGGICPSGTVTIPAGTIEVPLPGVAIIADGLTESQELFKITLLGALPAGATGAQIERWSLTARIPANNN